MACPVLVCCRCDPAVFAAAGCIRTRAVDRAACDIAVTAAPTSLKAPARHRDPRIALIRGHTRTVREWPVGFRATESSACRPEPDPGSPRGADEPGVTYVPTRCSPPADISTVRLAITCLKVLI